MSQSQPPVSGKRGTEEEALQVAEAAREKGWDKPGFLRDLFLGKLPLEYVHPYPGIQDNKRPEFVQFYEQMKQLLDEVDSDAIDREGKIPRQVIQKLARIGAFGMKIPREYGGLGLTLREYAEVMKLVCSRDGNLTALLSAHQSIGVPQPLLLFGTEEQKRKFLPRIARGAVTGFALTEPNVGSDPARLSTTVTESEDGQAYILNGEKLWCTNGTIAELLVVMARHPEDGAISAFIVDTASEGVTVEQHCRFMGLKALENARLRFTNVRVPKENLLWKRGNGLKLALITLNTGRLSLPAAVVGTVKTCLEICRRWANEREQWGKPIGKHEAIAHKIADMAVDLFALEAVADLATAMAESNFDIRLEAAVAKMYNSEAGWRIVDDTLQIRGGRGYETADSLRQRGEAPIAVERMMRDFRINLIFEGSSEIMRLFIAREALDKHLQVARVLLDSRAGLSAKLKALPGIMAFYSRWYLSLWMGWGRWPRYREFGRLAKHMRFANRATRKLARQIFHGMLRYQGRLQYKQAFLFRLVDIGAELFAMIAAISRATRLYREGSNRNALHLADQFCANARRRIREHFKALWANEDKQKYSLAQQVLDGQFIWLEEGGAGLERPRKDTAAVEHPRVEEELIENIRL